MSSAVGDVEILKMPAYGQERQVHMYLSAHSPAKQYLCATECALPKLKHLTPRGHSNSPCATPR